MVTGDGGPFFGGENAITRQVALLPPTGRGGGEKGEATSCRVCRRCNEPFEGRERGRPKLYCSNACKRAVEFEIRCLRDQLAETDDLLAYFENQADSFSTQRVDELREERAALVAKLLELNARPYARRRHE
jgi:hypothetical protein